MRPRPHAPLRLVLALLLWCACAEAPSGVSSPCAASRSLLEPTALARLAADASQRTPSGCAGAVPDRTVLLTYTNAHHFDLLLLQRRVAQQAGLSCLLERTLTLCLDDACSLLCEEHGLRCAHRSLGLRSASASHATPRLGSCTRYSAYDIGAADTRTDRKCAARLSQNFGARSHTACALGTHSYRTITFIKWLILHEVISSVDAALFFDDDVVFFSNPFKAFEPLAYDFRHQTESGTGCEAGPNGGLLYVRSSDAGRALLVNMVARKAEIEASGDKLDQDYVVAASRDAGAKRCAFPKAQFAGHCPRAQHAHAPVHGLVSYHAHCCAVKDSKMQLVQRVLAAREGPAGRTFGDVDRAPLPGFTIFSDTCYKPTWGDLKLIRSAWKQLDAALEWPAGGKGNGRALRGRLGGDVLR